MSDLISRSAVLKQLEDWKKNWENTEDSYEKTWALACIDFYIRLITNQPTAYDVEKVVEELKEWSFETEIAIPTSDGFEDTANREIICTLNAIEVVRKGGLK